MTKFFRTALQIAAVMATIVAIVALIGTIAGFILYSPISDPWMVWACSGFIFMVGLGFVQVKLQEWRGRWKQYYLFLQTGYGKYLLPAAEVLVLFGLAVLMQIPLHNPEAHPHTFGYVVPRAIGLVATVYLYVNSFKVLSFLDPTGKAPGSEP